MSRITILETPKVSLWYHPDEKIVHHRIYKFIYGEEFHQLLVTGTDLIKKHGATKWLSEISNEVLLRPEDLEWGKENWFPQTIAAGWKHWAIVQPKAVFVQMDLNPLVKAYTEAGINTKFFIDMDKAWEWLVSQK